MKEYKPLIVLAHLFFLAMFAFAAVFFIERFTYVDSSFYTFKLITYKNFTIELNRYSAFITQILPLLAVKCNLSLKYVLILYSVSFVLIYYIIFLVNIYLFKSIKAGIATTLVMILGICQAAFYPVTEIEFGVVLCILFYGYLEFVLQNLSSFSGKKMNLLLVLGAIIVLICLFCHPATLIPIVFILFFEMISYKLYTNKIPWLLLGFIILVFLIKLLTIKTNSYEGNKMEPLKNFSNLVIHLRSLYSWKFFHQYFNLGVYLLPLILIALSSLYYLIKGHYLKLIYFGFATAGCFVLLLIAHSPGESNVGMEKNFLPLWILAAVPFVHDFLLSKSTLIYLKSLVYLAILVSAYTFFHSATLNHISRTEYLRQILKTCSEKTGGNKFVLEYKSLNMDLIDNHWSIANESLLLSSLDGKDKSKSFYLVEDINKLRAEYDFNLKDSYLSVSFWLLWGNADLNHNYFNFKDEPYVLVEGSIPYIPKSR